MRKSYPIPNVLPGRYLLNDGATKQELKALERPTVLAGDSHQLPSISIAMTTSHSDTSTYPRGGSTCPVSAVDQALSCNRYNTPGRVVLHGEAILNHVDELASDC